MARIKWFFMIMIIFYNGAHLSACSTAIISGKVTPDGRPILWKHRDSDYSQNKLMYFHDGRYSYIALVNASDTTGKEVWGGCNSRGFAIINSASYNLKPQDDTTTVEDQEGVVMKEALKVCASVDEFELFLKNYPRPIRVEANFGVIDASGSGAYFETNNWGYTKFDVNDPAIAPHGYILRTNFSYTGEAGGGYGYIRYETTQNYFNMAEATHNLSIAFILNYPTRSFDHSLTGINYKHMLPQDNSKPVFVNFDDMVTRYSSTSTILIQGIKDGETADLTTMWTILGFQFCSVAVPSWVTAGEQLPKILTANKKQVAPLCDMAVKLKEQCFPVKRGSGDKYLNLAAVINREKSGIYQKLKPLEEMIINRTVQKLNLWRKDGYKKGDILNHYQWLDETVTKAYKNLFDLSCEF